MNTKTLLIALVALATATPVARSQDLGDAALTRMVSWFTGDTAVLNSPSCDAAASALPKNYAEDTCCGDGTCGSCSQCCHTHDVWGSVEFLMWWAMGTNLPP